MDKLFHKVKDKQCPYCLSESILTNGDIAICNHCHSRTKHHHMLCNSKKIVNRKGYRCNSCKLLFTCLACGSSNIRPFNGIFICQKCKHNQTSKDIHAKDHHTKKYVDNFHKVMHSFNLKRHLVKTSEGKQILKVISSIPPHHHWPKKPNNQVTVAALAYQQYCRNYPLK